MTNSTVEPKTLGEMWGDQRWGALPKREVPKAEPELVPETIDSGMLVVAAEAKFSVPMRATVKFADK